jgi:hypothetical protein
MKKQVKKLVLAKETVRNLQATESGEILGGITGGTSCGYPRTTCPREPITTNADC